MKLTNLLQLVHNLQQVGKIDNLQQSVLFLTVYWNEVVSRRHFHLVGSIFVTFENLHTLIIRIVYINNKNKQIPKYQMNVVMNIMNKSLISLGRGK